jgi:hypothetical protein
MDFMHDTLAGGQTIRDSITAAADNRGRISDSSLTRRMGRGEHDAEQ